jgi:hypothetical protein
MHTKVILREKRPGKMLMESELVHLKPAKRRKIIALRDEYEQLLRRVVKNNIDGENISSTHVKLAVYMISSMINRTRLWFSPKSELSAEEIGQYIFGFVVNGMLKRCSE